MRARQYNITAHYIKRVFIGIFLLIGVFYIVGMYGWKNQVSDFMEGLTNNINATLVYYPKKKSLNGNVSLTFKINDFIRESIEVPESIKIYKKLIHVPPEQTGNSVVIPVRHGEYSKQIEDTEIYKKFNTDIKQKETALLDDVYGDLFNSTKISGWEMEAISQQIYTKIGTENMLHNSIKYFTIHSIDVPYMPNEFSTYFTTTINAYKSQQPQLDTIKTFFYKIIGPSFVLSKLVDHYISNKSTYKSKDDVLFILNTAKEYLEKVKMDELANTNTNTVYIFKDDAKNFSDNTLTVESLTIFSIMLLFLKLLPILQSDPINLNGPEFSVMFATYMKKKFPDTKEPSILSFCMNPNNACEMP